MLVTVIIDYYTVRAIPGVQWPLRALDIVPLTDFHACPVQSYAGARD